MKIVHGGLYAADLGPRFGTEPGKGRLVLVVQSDLLNSTGHPTTWVLPCTTRLTGDSVLRVPLPSGVAGNSSECEVMIDQSRAIDNGRFRRLLGRVPAPLMREVRAKLRQLAEL